MADARGEHPAKEREAALRGLVGDLLEAIDRFDGGLYDKDTLLAWATDTRTALAQSPEQDEGVKK